MGLDTHCSPGALEWSSNFRLAGAGPLDHQNFKATEERLMGQMGLTSFIRVWTRSISSKEGLSGRAMEKGVEESAARTAALSICKPPPYTAPSSAYIGLLCLQVLQLTRRLLATGLRPCDRILLHSAIT
eukprot:c16361_g3_i1 orf=79-465(+)